MPQPLSLVIPNASLTVVPDYVERHQVQAAKVAAIMSRWACIEVQMGRAFAQLMTDTKQEVALALFHSSVSFQSKMGSLTSVIEHLLPEQEINLFRIMKRSVIEPLQKERNKLAHWVVVECSELPDALCYINPVNLLNHYSRPRSDNLEDNLLKQDLILVYRNSDLDALISSLEAAHRLAYQFVSLLARTGQAREALYLALCSEPPVQTELDRQLRRQKNGQSEPQPPTAQ